MLHKSIFTYAVAFFSLFATSSFAAGSEVVPQESGDGYINSSQQVVDLGLSVCWAGWNLGANSPEGYGDHYAWGETSPKSYFSEGTYTYHNGSDYRSIGSNISGTQYDAARAQWGGSWRMPTEVECDELVNRCSWYLTTYRGVDGYKVVGPNGNAIFLPFAGNYYCENENEIATGGDYWTGTYDSENNSYATLLYVTNEETHATISHWREFGRSIRAVCPRSSASSNTGGGGISANALRNIRESISSGATSTSSHGSSYSDSRRVDLGLSVCWASYNVGASSPSEAGIFYAWGETYVKSEFTESSYQYHNGYEYINIGTNIAGTSYDVARAQWGGNWRMPTQAEMQELVNRCNWYWTTVDGVEGYRVTGPNGNSIFLPAGGWYNNDELSGYNVNGNYWTSTSVSGSSYNAYYLDFYSGGDHEVETFSRDTGFSIRPVCP